MELEELNLTPRIFNSLKRAKISTVEQLVEMTDEQFSVINNFGDASLKHLDRQLAIFGFCRNKFCKCCGQKMPPPNPAIKATGATRPADNS